MTSIATKNGSLIVKDGSVAENCNCCGGWYCYQGTCPCNGFSPVCPSPGCLPKYIKISYQVNFPETAFLYYAPLLTHSAQSFSGTVTLTRGAQIGTLNYPDYQSQWNIDLLFPDSSYGVMRMWIQYFALQGWMKMVFFRAVDTVTVQSQDPCWNRNRIVYGNITTTNNPNQPDFMGYREWPEWVAYVCFSTYNNDVAPEFGLTQARQPTGLSQSGYCFGSGANDQSWSESIVRDTSLTDVACDRRQNNGYSIPLIYPRNLGIASVTLLDSYI